MTAANDPTIAQLLIHNQDLAKRLATAEAKLVQLFATVDWLQDELADHKLKHAGP